MRVSLSAAERREIGLQMCHEFSYRNFQMALTSLGLMGSPAPLSSMPDSGTDDKPRVRNIQIWMKEAWDAGMSFRASICGTKPHSNTTTLPVIGYDPQGFKDFKGSIVGTKKWIGTAGEKSAHSQLSKMSHRKHFVCRLVRIGCITRYSVSISCWPSCRDL